MKPLKEFLVEGNNPLFNKESKIHMIDGKEPFTIFTIDGHPILDYAQGDEKSIKRLINDVRYTDKVYILDYNGMYWEGNLKKYYTNKTGFGYSLEDITNKKVKNLVKLNSVVVKIGIL